MYAYFDCIVHITVSRVRWGLGVPDYFQGVTEFERDLRKLGEQVLFLGEPIEKDYDVMTKKTKSPAEKAGNNSSKTPYNRKRYVNVPLTPEDKDPIMELSANAHNLLVLFGDAVLAGYKFRISYDVKNNMIDVHVDGDDTAANKGLVLESHGSNLAVTLASAVYKVALKCDFGSWEENKEEGNWFN